MITIRTCPTCKTKWNGLHEILTNPQIRFDGYQENLREPLRGILLFTHVDGMCNSTFAVRATSFLDFTLCSVADESNQNILRNKLTAEAFEKIIPIVQKIANNQSLKCKTHLVTSQQTLFVSDIYEKRTDLDIYTCPSSEKLSKVLDLMKKKNVGSILVVNQQNELIGIFTEKDILKRCYTENSFINLEKFTLDDIMGKEVYAICKNDPLAACALIFTVINIRHLPLVDEFLKPIGIISIRDVFAHLTDWFRQF